jgi:NAD(P)-dependent dehydrogenase (short-subunit alcohol dehydrogenase family)
VALLGSQSAHDAGEGFSVYAASKGGLASAARVLGKEFAPSAGSGQGRRNVSVHCLEPGTVDTPMTRKIASLFSGRGTRDAGPGTHPSLAKNANFGGQARDEGREARLGDADFEMVSAEEVAADVVELLFSRQAAKSQSG